MKTLSWSANTLEPGQTATWPGSIVVANSCHFRAFVYSNNGW